MVLKACLTAASLSLLLGIASGAAAAQPSAMRPSFSCTKTLGAAERMICRDAELARLDRIMSDLFAETLSLLLNARQTAEATGAQRAWLAARNRCRDVQCLRREYFRRIHELAGELPGES